MTIIRSQTTIEWTIEYFSSGDWHTHATGFDSEDEALKWLQKQASEMVQYGSFGGGIGRFHGSRYRVSKCEKTVSHGDPIELEDLHQSALAAIRERYPDFPDRWKTA